MAGGPGAGSVTVRLEGAHLRVDARPSQLVSQLRGAGGDPVITAQRTPGEPTSVPVPAAARQVTLLINDELSVEATRAADFVALAEAGGRRLVVAFTGEVTVLPGGGGGGDRFALGAHEALVVPSDGGEPRVVPVASLSEEDQDEVSDAVEAASTAAPAAAAGPAVAEEPPAEEPVPDRPAEEEAPSPAAKADVPTPSTPAPAPAAAPARAAGASASPTKKAGSPPAKAAAQRQGGKKGKKGRPQQQPGKRTPPLVPAAAAAGGPKKVGGPTKKATTTPAKKAGGAGPGRGDGGRGGSGGGGGGGGHDDDSYEDTPADRRFVLGAVLFAGLAVALLAIFVLTGNDDDTDVDTAASTSTTEAVATTTTAAASTTAAPTTTARPATTTTAAPTTAPPTTVAPTSPSYAIEPKSCEQSGNTVTYTATVQNKAAVAYDFTIRVVFKDRAGAAVASAEASVSRLGQNQSADFRATGTATRDLAAAGATCDVERVDARPSNR